MRKIDYDVYRLQKAEPAARAYMVFEAAKKQRTGRRRGREQEEKVVLALLDQLRWQRALDCGRIERIGPRRYRYHG